MALLLISDSFVRERMTGLVDRSLVAGIVIINCFENLIRFYQIPIFVFIESICY
jgi:hypothetical protein